MERHRTGDVVVSEDRKEARSFRYRVCTVVDEDEAALAEWMIVQDGKERGLTLDDASWTSEFGDFQKQIMDIETAHELSVDFSELIHIGLIPLLSILVEAKNFCARTASRLNLRLESKSTSKLQPYMQAQHDACLTFIASRGFINALVPMPDGQVEYGHKKFHSLATEDSIEALLKGLIEIDSHKDRICLPARIVSLSELRTGSDAEIFDIVEGWLKEMTRFGIDAHFQSELELIDDFCHRARVLMTEVVHNAYDHSYDDSGLKSRSWAHFGILALIHTGDMCAAAAAPGMSQFSRGEHTTFLEIAFVDTGRGMLSDLEQWASHAEGKLREKLLRMRDNTNALHEVGKCLFRQPVSRHSRIDRTTDTGLQHIGYVLSEREDHVRLYSDGQWFGAMFPWPDRTSGSYENLKKRTKRATASGTAWHYILRLDMKPHDPDDPRFRRWKRIGSGDVESHQTSEDGESPWQYFDERFAKDSGEFHVWRDQFYSSLRCVWLPNSVTKQHVHQWISSINEYCSALTTQQVVTWLIADLSREQADTISRVLSRQKLGTSSILVRIVIVTNDWLIGCLSAKGAFMTHDDALTSAMHRYHSGVIFELLKSHDSTLFWRGILPNKDDKSSFDPNCDHDDAAFIDEPVIWPDDKGGSVLLNGYLDLTQALMSPRRRMIAMRALRRTWHLHSNNAECVASDELVTSLLPREARLSLQSRARTGITDRKKIAVGSVYVTGSTTDKLHQKGMQSIHLLRHGKVEGMRPPSNFPQTPGRFALNWTTADHECSRPEGKLQYERIPGTPYIGRGGGKAIPIRRFARPDDKNPAFSKSFYGQPPKEMYEHFRKLGIAKLGHWSYGKHHDLITINLGLAIDRDALLHGPITRWLLEILSKFRESGADIIVYPAHQSTEKIIQAAYEAAKRRGIVDDLPKHIVPLHFLSSHAQTTIRIPSPTYDRIRELIEVERERRRSEEEVKSSGSDDQRNNDDQKKHVPVEAILLDDGALTGKVQYELEQLIQNAGATTVFHLGLVNRTGLPLYRQYIIDHYRPTHAYYWRWDVPTLGNARTCPLCHAIAQAKELSKIVLSRFVSAELEAWDDKWQPQAVTSHWWRHGLPPDDLPVKRKVTFGKEWKKGGEKPERYSIPHTTTTGLAATIIEIMRTTSYKEVGARFIEAPWEESAPMKATSWRRARIELAVTQILLFFDDLDENELFRRFELLLQALIEPSHDREIELERLACLVLLLTPESQAKALIDSIIGHLGRHPGSLPLHVSALLGLLLRKASIHLFKLHELTAGIKKDKEKAIADSHLSTAFARGVEKTAIGTRNAILILTIALGQDNNSAHSGFVRRRINKEVMTSPQEVREDLHLLVKCLREIAPTLLFDTPGTTFSPTEHADALERIIALSDDRLFDAARNAILMDASSLVASFRREFIYGPKDIKLFIERKGVSEDAWKKQLEKAAKKHTESRHAGGTDPGRRWGTHESDSPRAPKFHVSADGVDASKYVIFPPTSRLMVREFLLNVAYSSDPYDDGSGMDMKCHLSLGNNSTLKLVMTNRCDKHTDAPEPKFSELNVSQHLLNDPVIRHGFDTDRSEFSIVIQLPLIEELAKEQPQ